MFVYYYPLNRPNMMLDKPQAMLYSMGAEVNK